jgi:hypothetical protein
VGNRRVSRVNSASEETLSCDKNAGKVLAIPGRTPVQRQALQRALERREPGDVPNNDSNPHAMGSERSDYVHLECEASRFRWPPIQTNGRPRLRSLE